ncbi:MAG: hypothetical protein D6675_12910, partial [Gemmatimonadetes bacterium]
AVLKEDVAVLKEDVAVLKEDVAVLKEDVAVLKEDVAVLKENVADLNNRTARLEHEFANMLAVLLSLKSALEGHVNETKLLWVYVRALSTAIQQATNGFAELPDISEEAVAKASA